MEFKYQFEEASPLVTVVLHPESTLDEVLTAFEGFLQAAGYELPGQLDFDIPENGNERE